MDELENRLSVSVRSTIQEKLDSPATKDYIAMTAQELVLYSFGAAEPESKVDRYLEKFLRVKLSDAAITAIHELKSTTSDGHKAVEGATLKLDASTKALAEITEQGHRTVKRATNHLAIATWALVLTTIVLVVVTVYKG